MDAKHAPRSTPPTPAPTNTPSRTVLLTGATGFVGGELLLRLMARDERLILCLVRAESDQAAKERGEARLAALLGREPRADESKRIEWIAADLEEANAGLSEAARRRVTQAVAEIFHCAASVEFDLPLADAHRINVGGVEALLTLARDAGPNFRRFHHVSTAYVAGRASGRVKANQIPTDHARNFRNTYERTKARAERLLRAQTEIPVSIYRPSIIAGDTRTGRTDNWNVLYVPMRQIVRGRLPFISRGGKAIADTVGVDFVVDGIVALAERENARIQAFHLTADHLAFDIERYLMHCNRAASMIGQKGGTRSVSPLSWSFRVGLVKAMAYAPSWLGSLKKIGVATRRGLKSFAPYLEYTRVNVEFDAQWEHDFLAYAGIHMPDPDIYLERIIDFAIEQDFGAASAPMPVEDLYKDMPLPVPAEPKHFQLPVAAAS
ncbi:MAG: SDR family oxidoreductase [Myxococcota bacterium]